MFDTILLAVDESDHSVKAAELTRQLATSKSDVVVLHVHETLPTRGGPVDIRVPPTDVAKTIATRLTDQDINARAEEARTYHGLVANRIVGTGTEEGADLICDGLSGVVRHRRNVPWKRDPQGPTPCGMPRPHSALIGPG